MESWFTEPKTTARALGQDRDHLAAGQRGRFLRCGDGGDRFYGRRLHCDPAPHPVPRRRFCAGCARLLAAQVLAPGGLRRHRLPLHRQSRLLAGDGRDDLARWVRDADQRHHRRAGRRRLGPSAVALRGAAAAARPHADAADLRLPDPDAGPLSSRLGAGPDLDGHFRHRRADPPHPSRHRLGARCR